MSHMAPELACFTADLGVDLCTNGKQFIRVFLGLLKELRYV